jgi:superfamily I DNA/RNA helicase/Txe/YoeB family toxin of Txe-Axe toxin-antitoxin module
MLYVTKDFNNDLDRLPADAQQRVHEAIWTIMRDPDNGGLNPEKIKRSKDLWSYRATQNVRIIARRSNEIIRLLAVDRHDAAYRRAERGAVSDPLSDDLARELRSSEAGSPLPSQAPVARDAGPLRFLSDEDLRDEFGVPPEWIPTLRSIDDEDQYAGLGIDEVLTEAQFFKLAKLFPAATNISTGAKPVYRLPSEAVARAFAAGEILDLQFNIPAQSRAIVESDRRAPILVKGGPGSGKTLVALYRAIHVMQPQPILGLVARPRVLYVTYTKQLRDDARNKVERLEGKVPDGLSIETYDTITMRLVPTPGQTLIGREKCRPFAEQALRDTNIDLTFFFDELEGCIEWRNIQTLDEYSKVSRRGRGARLGAAGRKELWGAYERYKSALAATNARDLGMVRMAAAEKAASLDDAEKFDFVIVDEVQDLPLPVLSMVVDLAKGQQRNKHIMLVGDAGQAIYQRGFRWADVGLRIGGGNVFTLEQSERSTQEILDFAGALLSGATIEDAELVSSPKHGQKPRVVHGLQYDEERRDWLAADVSERIFRGIAAGDIAIVTHSRNEFAAAAAALEARGVETVEQKDPAFYKRNAVKLITANSAKGLEFNEVYVPDASDGVYPFYKNRRLPDDERAERDAMDCKLLYVAATRAANRLTVLYHAAPSPFLEGALPFADITRAETAESVK